ncbi:unnamed protein product [Diamesa serratosioi]
MIVKQLVQLLTVVSLISIASAIGEPQLEVLKQWNLLNFDFPYDWPMNDKDLYNPEQVVSTGIEIGRDRLFLATPRLFSGVPATLTSIDRNSFGDSPVLKAYPNWSHHTAGTKQYNCSDIGLISVYRMKIDSCNRLWALDAGVSRSLEDFEVTCPPKILIYDLNTDQVVRRIDFPKEVIREESLFTNIIIDETMSLRENHCDDALIYISDTVAPGIVVYDSGRDLTWRLSHPSMFADPDFAESTIQEHKFTLMDGVVGLAFDVESRIVYFQPLATDRVFSVSAEALRAGPLPEGKELPVKLVGKKSSQGIALGASPYGGNIFFSPFTETAIAQYNPKTNEQKVLSFDAESLQFIADFKTSDNDPGALYMISSKFHRFFLKNLNSNEVNTRILRIRGYSVVQTFPSTFDNKQAPYSYYNTINYAQQYPSKQLYSSSGTTYLNHQTSPTPFNNNPQRPFYNLKPQSPYSFQQFGMIEKSINNPFFKLNTGEQPNAPQQPASLQNYKLTGEYYRPSRFQHRSPSYNTTTVYH